MITPGFFSFFNAQRGLIASQMAMNTVSHNVTNANTPGFSRQRVDLSAMFPYATPSLVGPDLSAGLLGQGVMVDGVSRIRDNFIDGQYRLENSILSSNVNIRDVLKQIEGVLGEPSTGGINGSMENFFHAAQEMSLDPTSTAVRADFLQQAVDLVTVFQQQANQLSSLRRNLVGEPGNASSYQTSILAITVNDINNKLDAITQLNREINSVLASNATPNDLYDKRDLLLDQLSQMTDITVTRTGNQQINISIGGVEFVRGTTQTNSLQVVENTTGVPYPIADQPALVQTTADVPPVVMNNAFQYGQIRGILDMGGNSPNVTTVRGVLEDLNSLITSIANTVNNLQATGRNLNGQLGTAPGQESEIFTLSAGASLNIFRYSVNQNVLNDNTLVSAAINDATAVTGVPPGFAGVGDGRNALLLAQLRDGANGPGGNTFVDFFNGVVSSLGIDSRSYSNKSENQQSLVSSLDQRRQAISGVNVDEEMIDMLRFQRAFEASSRMIQVFDEVIKQIIGIAG